MCDARNKDQCAQDTSRPHDKLCHGSRKHTRLEKERDSASLALDDSTQLHAHSSRAEALRRRLLPPWHIRSTLHTCHFMSRPMFLSIWPHVHTSRHPHHRHSYEDAHVPAKILPLKCRHLFTR